MAKFIKNQHRNGNYQHESHSLKITLKTPIKSFYMLIWFCVGLKHMLTC